MDSLTAPPMVAGNGGRTRVSSSCCVLATTLAVLAALSWFHRNQVDEARSAQITLNQIAVLTREINNLTWTALQKQNLTPEAEIEMRAARQALPKAVLGERLHTYHTYALAKLASRLRKNSVRSVTRKKRFYQELPRSSEEDCLGCSCPPHSNSGRTVLGRDDGRLTGGSGCQQRPATAQHMVKPRARHLRGEDGR